MATPTNDLNSLTTEPEEQTLTPSSSDESTQKLNADSPSVLTPEEEARATEARAELEKKAEEAKSRRASRGSRGSSDAAKAVKEAAAKAAEEEQPKRRARAKAKVDDAAEQDVEVEGFEERDVVEFLDVTDEILTAFKVQKLSDRQKTRLAKPLTRVINKRLNKKMKKFSDETQVLLLVGGLVLERLNLGKQSRHSVRDEGAGQDNIPANLTPLRTASAGN